MSRTKPTSFEMLFLQEVLSAECKKSNIRLREGEYQYGLAKSIMDFQLNLHFPNVKDIIKKAYGEEEASDIHFIRKIQTILKKMEKSNIVRILPKKKPWELQRYAVLSCKFQDVDKNLVVLATDQQILQAQDRLNNLLINRKAPTTRPTNIKIKIFMLVFALLASYAGIIWALVQPIIDPIIFVFAFSSAVMCSILLGKALSEK